MLRRLLVLAMLLCTFGVLSAGGAGASSTLNLAYDCGPVTGTDCFSDRDMIGSSAGWVIPRQRSNGDLQLNVQVRGGDANTTYSITVYCGPTHFNAMNPVFFGSLSTDATGRGGNTNLVIPAAEIATWCGSGSHTGHIDLDSAVSTLAATPLTFSSP